MLRPDADNGDKVPPFESVRRKLKELERNAHGLWQVLKALTSTDHPLLAHLIPMRRCNLACTYCNEFDNFSKPVPLDLMLGRVDKLKELGTSVVTISGGEPLLHPELDAIIHRMRERRVVSGLITNGYLLTADRIHRLNHAGLEWLQISIDNVNPDQVSKKSLKVLDRKLQLLAEHAEFHVNINSVVGGGVMQSAGCPDHRPPRARIRFQFDYRHYSRRLRPVAAAER